jgi:biopolymer transport protein ExbD
MSPYVDVAIMILVILFIILSLATFVINKPEASDKTESYQYQEEMSGMPVESHNS